MENNKTINALYHIDSKFATAQNKLNGIMEELEDVKKSAINEISEILKDRGDEIEKWFEEGNLINVYDSISDTFGDENNDFGAFDSVKLNKSGNVVVRISFGTYKPLNNFGTEVAVEVLRKLAIILSD